MAILSELAEAMAALLPTVPGAGLRLALGSSAALHSSAVGVPSWLALRRLDFRWHCRFGEDAGKVKFLFLTVGRSSARDRLGAEVLVSVRPVPADAEDIVQATAAAATVLELPEALAWSDSPDLTVRPSGDREFVIALDRPDWDLTDDETPEHIRLARWPGGPPLAAGTKAVWPVAAFVALAQALAGATAVGGGQRVVLGRPAFKAAGEVQPPLRETIAELLAILRAAPGLLAKGHASPGNPEGHPLPTGWRIAEASARLGILVDPGGLLAAPRARDTFLVPFDVEVEPESDPVSARVALGWPDFVLSGAVRTAMVAHCEEHAPWKNIVKGTDWDPDRLKSWLEDESQAVFLRVDREPADEEVALVLSGEVDGTSVAVLLHAGGVVYTPGETPDTFHVRSADWEVLQAGPLAGRSMEWRTRRGGGKQIFCDLMHGLLRWHALLRAALRHP